MKNKRLANKKLSLNKKTISDLGNAEMDHVRGGLTFTDPRVCDTGGGCSKYYTRFYTCDPGCPNCLA